MREIYWKAETLNPSEPSAPIADRGQPERRVIVHGCVGSVCATPELRPSRGYSGPEVRFEEVCLAQHSPRLIVSNGPGGDQSVGVD